MAETEEEPEDLDSDAEETLRQEEAEELPSNLKRKTKNPYYDITQETFYKQIQTTHNAFLSGLCNRITKEKQIIGFKIHVNTVYQECGNNKNNIRAYLANTANKSVVNQIWNNMKTDDKKLKLPKVSGTGTDQVEYSTIQQYCTILKIIYDLKKQILDTKNDDDFVLECKQALAEQLDEAASTQIAQVQNRLTFAEDRANVSAEDVAVAEQNYEVCKKYCEEQKIICMQKYISEMFQSITKIKTSDTSAAASNKMLQWCKKSIIPELNLLVVYINQIEESIVEDIINAQYIDKVIKTQVTEHNEKCYVAKDYEIQEKESSPTFKVYYIKDQQQCTIDYDDYLEIEFNLQNFTWNVSSIVEQTLHKPHKGGLLTYVRAKQKGAARRVKQVLIPDLPYINGKINKASIQEAYTAERQTKQVIAQSKKLLAKARRYARSSMSLSERQYNYYKSKASEFIELESAFIDTLDKKDINNKTKFDLLNKICNVQRISFPVMQDAMRFVAQNNSKIEFCNVTKFSSKVQEYVKNAYVRNDHDSDYDDDADSEVEEQKRKEAKDTKKMLYFLGLETTPPITADTNLDTYFDNNFALIKSVVDKGDKKTRQDIKNIFLKVKPKTYFTALKEKKNKQQRVLQEKKESKKQLVVMQALDKAVSNIFEPIQAETDLSDYFDKNRKQIFTHVINWFPRVKTPKEGWKSVFQKYYINKFENKNDDLQHYFDAFDDTHNFDFDNAKDYVENNTTDFIDNFEGWLDAQSDDRDEAIDTLKTKFIAYYAAKYLEDATTEEDEDALNDRKRKRADERNPLIQWRNPESEDDSRPKKKLPDAATVKRVSSKRKAADSVDADTRHPLLQWRDPRSE